MLVEPGEGDLINRTATNRGGEEIAGSSLAVGCEDDIGLLADFQLVREWGKRAGTGSEK
jgi:hypothetical protein